MSVQVASMNLEYGGAFSVDGASKVTIVDSKMINVTGGMLGGVFGCNGCTLDISGSHFERATAEMLGAFVTATGTAQIDLRNSVLRDVGRKATDWSAQNIMLINGPTIRVSGVRFETSPGGYSKGAFAINKVPPTRHHAHTPNIPCFALPLDSLSSCALLLATGNGNCR